MRSLASILKTSTALLYGAVVQVACNESDNSSSETAPAQENKRVSDVSQPCQQSDKRMEQAPLQQASAKKADTACAKATSTVDSPTPREEQHVHAPASIQEETPTESIQPSAADILQRDGICRKGYAKALRQATIEGNIERLSLLYDAGANLHIHNKKSGDTLLHSAVLHGQKEAVQFLLNKGVKVDKKNHSGLTPLMLATEIKQKELMMVLGKAGADPNAKLPSGKTLLQSVIEAADTEAIPLLAEIGANIHFTDKQGNTLLHFCAEHGYTSALEALISTGADLHARNRMKEAPLHLAVKHHQQQCILLLQQHGAVDDLLTAAMLNDSATAQAMLSNGESVDITDADGCTPMHIAAKNGYTELACLLLQHGADALRPDKNKYSALATARLAGHAECAQQMAHTALQKAGIENTDSSHIFSCIEQGKASTLSLLMAAGADPNACTPEGWSALHVATMHNKSACLEILLKYGANAQAAPASSFTALHLAVTNDMQECLNILLQADIDINVRTDDGCTALHLATRVGNHQALQELIKAGADVNAKNLRGDTPLNELARWAWGRADSAQALVNAGADCNICNILNESPLHAAAISGNKHCLAVLISAGTDTTQKSNSGKTPLELARYHGQHKCAALLQAATEASKQLTAAEPL